MIGLTVAEMVRACGGNMISGMSDMAIFTSYSTDTRTINPGDLFIALKGEKHDGRDFVSVAVDKGAMGIVAQAGGDHPFIRDMARDYEYITVIEVADGLAAYQKIAGLVRRKSKAMVIAVTGSTGKTTTKDMLAAIMGRVGSTVASKLNFNNEYGVPATIMECDEDTRFLIVEMGMRGAGQIAESAAIAKPNIGVITNIGLAHVELLGSREEIAKAKAELAESLNEKGTLVINADNEMTAALAESTAARTVTFGQTAEADVRAADTRITNVGTPDFKLSLVGPNGREDIAIRLRAPGRWNVMNAAAAAAAAQAAGAGLSDIIAGLEEAELSDSRASIRETDSGITVIDDTYNANPDSMAAAVSLLGDIEGKRKIAALGDMLELGAESGIDVLFTTGEQAAAIGEAAVKFGMPAARIHSAAGVEELCNELRKELKAGDVVLAKASRAMRFERIVECIK
jgi:UDP-N-acetylmuramoyl-tripeptide--D-alanyl-D-alanine ligase